MAPEVDLDQFFAGLETARPLLDRLDELVAMVGGATRRVTRTQVAYRRRRTFALFWLPARHLGAGRGAPAVLSVVLDHDLASARVKEVVQPTPGQFLHHLELHSPDDLDDEVAGWLQEAAELSA